MSVCVDKAQTSGSIVVVCIRMVDSNNIETNFKFINIEEDKSIFSVVDVSALSIQMKTYDMSLEVNGKLIGNLNEIEDYLSEA
jgi:hypothetical protein